MFSKFDPPSVVDSKVQPAWRGGTVSIDK